MHALAVLFGARRPDHTRADDLRLALGTAPLARSAIQPRLYAQVPETIPEVSSVIILPSLLCRRPPAAAASPFGWGTEVATNG